MRKDKIEQYVKVILKIIGEDPHREGLQKTPERVAKAYEYLFQGYNSDPEKLVTTFEGENYDEMIIARDIEFYSMCEHHILPFFGTVTIGYIPNDKIIGVSKMPRLVEVFSRRLQNQERMTDQIADAMLKYLNPKGVGVVATAKHLCMMSRGIEKQNASVMTSSLRGIFKTKQDTRNEFLSLAYQK